MPKKTTLSLKFFIFSSIILIFFSLILLPFEIPDEQSHYATVHYLIDTGQVPGTYNKQNLSAEEMEAEYLFGIMTDGTNKYARNPSYKPEYTETLFGKYEKDIANLNTPENRSTYTIHQAAIYPPLYYWYSSLFYKPVYSGDIITRLYTTRISSILLTILIIYLAYKIGLEIFSSNIYAFTLASLTLLYPMTSFMGVGVNSDNLHNLLFAIFTLQMFTLINHGLSKKLSLSIGIIIGLDLITKPQAYIMFPILGLGIILTQKRIKLKNWATYAFLLITPIVLLAGWQEIPKFVSAKGNPYAISDIPNRADVNFSSFVKSSISRLSREIIVWYWGVFKWQGVILPRIWWWTGIRLFGLAGISVIIKIWQDLKSKKRSKISRIIIFSIFSNLIYAVALFWFDWQFYQRTGRSLGMQARYFMPLLITQMIILLIGLTNLGRNKRIKEWIRKGILLFFVGLQLTATWTIVTSYYDTSTLQSLIIQASQYKPWYAKGNWWYLWILLYILSTFKLAKYSLISKKSKQLVKKK